MEEGDEDASPTLVDVPLTPAAEGALSALVRLLRGLDFFLREEGLDEEEAEVEDAAPERREAERESRPPSPPRGMLGPSGAPSSPP